MRRRHGVAIHPFGGPRPGILIALRRNPVGSVRARKADRRGWQIFALGAGEERRDGWDTGTQPVADFHPVMGQGWPE